MSFHWQLLFPTLSSCSSSISYWGHSDLGRPPSCLSKLKYGKDIRHHNLDCASLHSVCVPALLPSSTWDASPPSDLTTLLLFSQLLPEGETERQRSLQHNMHSVYCKEGCNLFSVIYWLQLEQYKRIQLRWRLATLEEPLHYSMPPSLPPSLSPALSASLSLIFWGWVYPKGTLHSWVVIGWRLGQWMQPVLIIF